MIRRLILTLALAAGIAPAFGQSAPPPVPAMPDAERRTTYTLSSTTCACSVGFALYGDSTDYGSWVEVFLNGVLQSSSTYTITSPTGPLATIPRPITDAVLTFNASTTGTVQIVGARRPRRTILFAENRGVAGRDLNQGFNDIYAMLREDWDKINDTTGRAVLAPPGETLALLPVKASRLSQGACFDSNGNLAPCVSIPSSTFVAGNGITFTGTNPTTIALSTAGASTFRTKLAAPTTFYVATNGVDQTGCGLASGTNACRTRGYLYNIFAANYDFGGQTVTVSIAAGTYTDSLQAQGNLLIGQTGGAGLIFTGDCTSGHRSDVVIQPAANTGYAYSADSGASYRIQCQVLDQTNQRSVYPNGADIVVAAHGSKLYFGNPSLYAAGNNPDLTFGCNFNGFNAITASFLGQVEFDNDFTIDVGRCQVAPTGTVTNGSANITGVSSNTNVVQNMGIVAANVPSDAYVASQSTGTITMGCLYTSPCQATGTATETITIVGGGQDFLDLGNGATGYFNTNGQPDFSLIATMSNFPFYQSGFFFINEGSTINAQSITFVSPENVHGKCSIVKSLSNIDTNLQGIPYLPCKGQSAEVLQSSVSVTAGASSITVASTANIKTGMICTDVAAPTATFTAGASTMTVSSNSGIAVGAKVTGPGILAGAVVSNVSGTTITVSGCGSGPKCVGGSPLYLSETGQTVYFSNSVLNGNVVVGQIASGTVFNIMADTPFGGGGIKSTTTIPNLWCQGQVIRNSVYD